MAIKMHLAAAGFAASLGVCHAADDIAWRHSATWGAVTLTANPLAAAARKAFYVARGFAPATIAPYVQACGFSFGMRNSGRRTVHTSLADWRAVGSDGRAVRLRLPAAWDAEWTAVQVPQAARIAFRWAQFQAENSFEPGDWIMGMATLEAPPGGKFRLTARYRDDQGNHEIVLDELVCANDAAD